MGKPEATVEDYLVASTEARGGWAAKMIDLGRRGAPDRVLYLPGRPIWVETKAKNGALKLWQSRYHEDLRTYGYAVLVLWTKEQVDQFFTDYDMGMYAIETDMKAALKIAHQALLEVGHAQEVGANWYTRGADGLYRQTAMWIRRARIAIAPWIN